MINTVADLLGQLQIKEKKLLEQYSIIGHSGLIGGMYEGLTKDILTKSIFEGLDLKVRAGKIKNSAGDFSAEIDCMLVLGEGEQIPYSDKYIYESTKVIAVIEVKKNLFSKGIKEAYHNLKSVIDITDLREGEEYHGRILRDSWRAICKEELPARDKLNELDFEKEMIYHTLLLEAFYPARIVWGYNGFKSEFNLREAYINYLEDNISSEDNKVMGFGPVNFPNLIICDQNSIIKANGIPFAHHMIDDGYWPFLVSSNEQPVYYLLEVIWTRLHYMFGISAEIFGEDLKVDEMHGLLLGRCLSLENMKGWEYEYVPMTEEQLEIPLAHKDWEPVFLTQLQYIFFNELCRNEAIDYKKDKDLNEAVIKNGITIEEFVESLKETGLVSINGSEVRLITEQCVCGISREGKYFCGENKTGRVTRWSMKN